MAIARSKVVHLGFEVADAERARTVETMYAPAYIPSVFWGRVVLGERVCHAMPPIVAYRLGKLLLARERPTPPREFVTETITGSMYGYRTGDLLADSVRFSGFWDWRIVAIAQVVAGPGAHVIEIGANTGTETLGLADVVAPGGTVTAFEPAKANLAALEANIARNRHRHIRIRPEAVGDRVGTAVFTMPAGEGNSGVGHIDTIGGDTGHRVEVDLVTIDSLESELGPAALITVDVEGFEVAVLAGAENYIGRHRPVLCVEAGGEHLPRAGSSLDELARRLDELAYETYEIDRVRLQPLRPIPPSSQPEYIKNWLAIPKERSELRRRIDRTLVRYAVTPQMAGLHPLKRRRKTMSA